MEPIPENATTSYFWPLLLVVALVKSVQPVCDLYSKGTKLEQVPRAGNWNQRGRRFGSRIVIPRHAVFHSLLQIFGRVLAN